MKIPDSIEPQVRAVAELVQDQWFDRTRRIHTSGDLSLHDAGVDAGRFHDSEAYQPARPAHIRQALRDTNIVDFAPYSYVDLGSGKGRSLFIAAERPFRQIIGVELSPRLHAIAVQNIQSFRWARPARPIHSVHQDATRFSFPDGPLVLYMFNPFGRTTVRQVLANLQMSLDRQRRHIVVLLLWPQWADEVMALPGMSPLRKTHEYQIFEVHRPFTRAV